VLAHEFGHALGLDHVEDPQAIMYYLMDKQNIKDLKLTTDDINALKKGCNIR
jgi:predicted Zn-dependent protease